jgi:hypothetical protein
MKRMLSVTVLILLAALLLTSCQSHISKDSLVAAWGFDTQLKVVDGEFIVEKNAEDIDFSQWDHVKSVETGMICFGGIKEDGTVIITNFRGDELNVANWQNIRMLKFTLFSAYGLKEDGTIISSTMNTQQENEIDKTVSSWSDIVWIDTADTGIVGVKKDGSVLLALNYCSDSAIRKLERKLSKWTDIRMAEFSGILDRFRVVGLSKSGEIVEAQFEELREYDLDSYEELTGAVKICAGEVFTAGLMPDGTLRITCGGEYEGFVQNQPDYIRIIDLPRLDDTKNVLDINHCGDILVVLQKDGTILTGGVEHLD